MVTGVVGEDLLAALDDEIDELVAADPSPAGTVGKHFWFLPPARLPAAGAALRRSSALAIAEELVAPRRLDHGFDHIQIALNIPPHVHKPGGPHIDGHGPGQDPRTEYPPVTRSGPAGQVPPPARGGRGP